MADKITKYAISILLSILLLSSGIVIYVNHNIELIKQDYGTKILDLNNEVVENLKSLKTALENQMEFLNYNLSSRIGDVSVDLEDFKRQNELQINAISNLIDQIEKQSNIQLNELKGQLRDIQIKSADFSAIIDDVLQSVVSVKTNLAQGSGAIINADGYIVTNVHVIQGASAIKAVANSGKTYNAAVIGIDEATDIALLKINTGSLKPLNFGDSAGVKVGEKVLAAGNPAGLGFTVTEGIVSAFRRFENNIRYIQTDVPINPGNSGGPLINARGEIVGINNFKIGGFESLGFAIASNEVKSVADRIIREYEARQNQ